MMIKRSAPNNLSRIWLLGLFGSLALLIFVANQAVFADGSGDVTVSVEITDSVPEQPKAQQVNLQSGDVITNTKVDVVLVGLEPFSLVQIYAQSDPILIASGFADKYGVFKASPSLPPGLEAGDHSVVASTQKRGESAPTLKSLVKFSVSARGVVTNKSKPTSSKPTETSAPGVTAKPEDVVEGVVFVSGTKLLSDSTFNPQGNPAATQLIVMNAYKSPFSLTVNETVKIWGLFPIADLKSYSVANLKAKEARIVSLPINAIGQWGFYTVDFEVLPPEKIDDISLPAIHRQQVVWVTPYLTLTVVFAMVCIELIRRFVLMPYLRGRRLLESLIEPETAQL